MKSILKGLVSVTFRELTPVQIIDLAVKSGVDGIEWGADVHIKPGEFDKASTILEYSNSQGIKVLSYASYYKSGASDPQDFDLVLQTAVKLQAPRIRLWAGNKDSALFSQLDYQQLVEDLQRVSALAQSLGIEVGIEFHNGTYTDSSLSTQQLFKSLSGSALYSYWQPPLGTPLEDNLQTIRSLGKAIRMVHCFHWTLSNGALLPHLLKEGRDLWTDYLNALIQHTSIDTLSLEFVLDSLENNYLEDALVLNEMISHPPFKTILLAAPGVHSQVFSPSFIQKLSRSSLLLSDHETAETLPNSHKVLSEVEVIIGTWGMPLLDEALLLQMPQLKAVFYAAGSVKYFLTPAFWSRSLLISSAQEANAIPVAEFSFAHIILALKQYWHHVLHRKPPEKFNGERNCFGAYQSKVGLVSLGAIARRVVEKLKTLEVELLVYDPFVSQESATAWGIKLVSLEELFSQADVVSIHAPWLPQTEKLIQKKHFLLLKKGATVINTARGAVIDEPGMIEALQERPDLWAVLDVTHPEPPLADSPLYSLPNVLLSPHLAGSMGHECHRMADWMLEEMLRFQQGKPLKHQVLEKELEKMA